MKKRSILPAAVVFTLSLGGMLGYQSNAAAAGDLQQKKSEIESKLSNVESEMNKKENQISDIQDKQASLGGQLEAIESKIQSANKKISEQEQNISTTKDQIADLKKNIAEIKKRIEDRNAILKDRARAMQKNGGGSVNYLDIFLEAKSVGDFIDRFSAVKTLVEADRQILEEQKKDEQDLKDKQASVEKKLSDLESMLSDLQSLKDSLKQDESEKSLLIKKLEKQKDSLKEEKMSLSEQKSILADQKASIEKAIAFAKKQAEEERKAAAKADTAAKAQTNAGSIGSAGSNAGTTRSASVKSSSGSHSGGSLPQVSSGSFTRPASGYISSEFGGRSGGFHPGIDIANSIGTPVVAAADGVVFRAYHSSSYGNCVMITHYINGKLYTTVYAHLSSYSVSTGQHVSKGQQIGAMGNTGESTGPHLHFEIYNGRWTPPPHTGAQNPRNYVNF